MKKKEKDRNNEEKRMNEFARDKQNFLCKNGRRIIHNPQGFVNVFELSTLDCLECKNWTVPV